MKIKVCFLKQHKGFSSCLCVVGIIFVEFIKSKSFLKLLFFTQSMSWGYLLSSTKTFALHKKERIFLDMWDY